MPATIIDNEPIAPAASEQAALDQLRGLLECPDGRQLKLVGPEGTPVNLPPSVVHVLRRAVDALAQQRVVLVEDLPMDLTLEDAANLAHLLPSELARLIDQGRLPSTLVRNRRRVPFGELMNYMVEREAERDAALDELTQLSQDLGLYHNPDEPT